MDPTQYLPAPGCTVVTVAWQRPDGEQMRVPFYGTLGAEDDPYERAAVFTARDLKTLWQELAPIIKHQLDQYGRIEARCGSSQFTYWVGVVR